MSRPRNNLRLFVAAYPPMDIARALLAALPKPDLRDFRLTPVEQVHMTLQFIGDTPVKEMDATIESVERSASGLPAMTLVPLRLMTLPRRGPKRLVAAETDAPPTLLELQRRLAHRLATNVRDKPGSRFLPHLTLCRFRAPARMEALDEPLPPETFVVNEVSLMRSTLTPDGAQHHEVAAFPLAGP